MYKILFTLCAFCQLIRQVDQNTLDCLCKPLGRPERPSVWETFAVERVLYIIYRRSAFRHAGHKIRNIQLKIIFIH